MKQTFFIAQVSRNIMVCPIGFSVPKQEVTGNNNGVSFSLSFSISLSWWWDPHKHTQRRNELRFVTWRLCSWLGNPLIRLFVQPLDTHWDSEVSSCSQAPLSSATRSCHVRCHLSELLKAKESLSNEIVPRLCFAHHRTCVLLYNVKEKRKTKWKQK